MVAVTRPTVERTGPAELVQWALAGRIRLPRFQRPFRWEAEDVRRLFDSILRGYPIGILLMWRRPASAGSLEIGPLVLDTPDSPDALWVIDGQQRITSLVGVLAAPADTVDPRFRVFFDLRTERFESAGRREHVPEHWLPLRVTLRNDDLLQWWRDRPGLADEEFRRCDAVVDAIRGYEIPMAVIEGDIEQAADVFSRVNTSGRPLQRAEVFEALNTAWDEMGPTDLQALSALVRSFGFGELPDEVLLQSLLAIRSDKTDRDLRNEFRSEDDRHEAFARTEQALGHVVDFLREGARIPHVRLLPYSVLVPVLSRFTALFGPPEGRAADLLSRWIWRGAVLGATAQLGNSAGLRRNASAVYDDPVESADRLLAMLPAGGENWVPDLDQTHPRSVQAKLNVLALLDERPVVLVPTGTARVGSAVDVVGILQEGESPLARIHVQAGSLADRLVHPSPHEPNGLLAGIPASPPELWGSQCLDEESVRLLARGDLVGFTEHRRVILERVIARNVQRHALFGFRDGPDLRSLFAGEAGPDAA